MKDIYDTILKAAVYEVATSFPGSLSLPPRGRGERDPGNEVDEVAGILKTKP